MSALPNAAHEKFAMLIASDKPPVEAYALVGFQPDRSNASKLARRPEIAERVSELQAQALDRQGITRERIIDEAAAIAFVDLSGILPDGTIEPGHRLTPAQARAIVSIETTTDARGKRTNRVRFGDRLRALELLGKWGGLERPVADQHLHLHAPVASPFELFESRMAVIAARFNPPDTSSESS